MSLTMMARAEALLNHKYAQFEIKRKPKKRKLKNNGKNALNIPDIVLPIFVIAPFSSIASMRYNCFNASSNDSAAYYR